MLNDISGYPPQRESDLDHPLQWFEDFIEIDQPFRFLDNFYQTATDPALEDPEIDYINLEYSYTISKTKDGFKLRTTFKYEDFLRMILDHQFRRSKELISQKIDAINSLDDSKFLVVKLFDKLEYLILLLKKHYNHPIREFSSVPLTIYKLAVHIEHAHKSCLPSSLPGILNEAKAPSLKFFTNLPKTHIEDPVTNITPIETCDSELGNTESSSPNHTPFQSFAWNKKDIDYTEKLYLLLLNLEILKADETDLTTFRIAFNGQTIEEPLLIKWHLQSSHRSFKTPIIRMIEYLSQKLKLLQKPKNKADLCRKIEYIFADQSGNQLQNVLETHYQMGKQISMEEKEMLSKLRVLA